MHPYGTDGTFRCFALFGSYFMLEACLWVMYADIAQSYRVSAFTTFGFGHGLLSAGSSPVSSCCNQAVFWKRCRPNR